MTAAGGRRRRHFYTVVSREYTFIICFIYICVSHRGNRMIDFSCIVIKVWNAVIKRHVTYYNLYYHYTICCSGYVVDTYIIHAVYIIKYV